MSKTIKATLLIVLMVGLGIWVAAVAAQQGAQGASNEHSVDWLQQNTQDELRFSRQADDAIDTAELTLISTTVLTPTSYLPIVVRPCIPSLPGESDNIADALTICSGQTVTGRVNDSDWDDVYKIYAVANQQLTISMNGTGVGGPGDADLYLYPPGTTNVNTDPYVDASENIGNNEFIQGTVLVGGFWYVDVFDCCEGDGGTNYNLTVTLSGPGAAGTEAFDLTEIDLDRVRGRSKMLD